MLTRRINLNDFSALDNQSSRRVNESIVLNLIRERQPIFRAELARVTELKESTICSIVKRLSNEGLVYEAAIGDSTGGRKPRMLRLNGKHALAIGVDLGFLETTLGLGNLNGEILFKKSIKTIRDPQLFLPQVADEIEVIIKSKLPRGARLEGIGMSLPGITDRAKGEVIYGAYLNWRNVPVGEVMRQRFKQKLAFDDDQNTSGLAELWFGDFSELPNGNLITVMIREGVGTALIIGGHLYRGSNLGAGQFGHVSLDPEGPLCTCGSQGCWEMYASDIATVNRYRRYIGEHDDQIPFTVSELASLATQGEEAAARALRETGKYLGMGISILVNGLNPEVIIIDGQICEAWNLVEPEIHRILKSRALALNLESLQIRPSKMKENPSLLGAISLILCQRFAAPQVV